MQVSIGKIYSTFLMALILTVIPLPIWANWYRPEWVLLALIFWSMCVPEVVGLITAWVLGLMVDALQATVLGQNAFIFSMIVFLVIPFQQRLRLFPIWQQAIVVLFLLLFAQVLLICIHGILGHLNFTWHYFSPVILSTLLWPWMALYLNQYHRR
jgi:rod shape-determining protein MreD